MSPCVPIGFLSPGPLELILIFLAVLVLFGPRRLPEIARSIGKVLNDLRRASEEFKDQVMAIEVEPPAPAPAATETVVTDDDLATQSPAEAPCADVDVSSSEDAHPSEEVRRDRD